MSTEKKHILLGYRFKYKPTALLAYLCIRYPFAWTLILIGFLNLFVDVASVQATLKNF